MEQHSQFEEGLNRRVWLSWIRRVLGQVARLEEQLKLAETMLAGVVDVPASRLSINVEFHMITVDDEPVQLTVREWGIMAVLVSNAGRVVTPQQMLREVWGREYRDEGDYIRTYIRRLRKKIEPDPGNPRHILLERGVGYRLVLN